MSYEYATEKPAILTDDGKILFLKIRDNVDRLLKASGAVRMNEAISGCTGSSWHMLACVDRLCEIGEIIEVPNPFSSAGQYRLFIRSFR